MNMKSTSANAWNFTSGIIGTSLLITTLLLFQDAASSDVGEEVRATCPDAATQECNATMKAAYCLHGGVCCMMDNKTFCACAEGYEGDRCQKKTYVLDALESHDNALKMTLLSSGISLTITTLALAALILVTVMIVRRSRSRLEKVKERAEDLDKEILFVQGELAKLSPAEKMTRLTRLSKIIEATARAALLSYPSLISPPPGGPNARITLALDVLPRWSSAPSALDRPFEGLTMDANPEIKSAGICKPSSRSTFKKKPLQQVFSL